jgi:hypothetical protein
MIRNCLGVFECAAIMQIGRDSGGPEGMTAGGVGQGGGLARRLIMCSTSNRVIGFAVSWSPLRNTPATPRDEYRDSTQVQHFAATAVRGYASHDNES